MINLSGKEQAEEDVDSFLANLSATLFDKISKNHSRSTTEASGARVGTYNFYGPLTMDYFFT